MEDFYKTLNVDRDANQDQIKKAYRKLAIKYHPDKNAGNKKAEERFKKISEAYSVLSNDQHRAEYDHLRQTGGRETRNPFSGMGGFGDIFGDFFNRGGFSHDFSRASQSNQRQHPKAKVNPDLQLRIELSFWDCVNGAKIPIQYNRAVACSVCEGHGFDTQKDHGICKPCRGHGQITQRHGTMVIQTTCRNCSGTGMEPAKACYGCHGQGSADELMSMDVNVPKGVKPGQKIRLRKSGHILNSVYPPGDLYLEVVAPNSCKEFTRKEYDIYSEESIPFITAILGGEIQVNTISGIWVLRIPKGCQPGSTLMIEKAGICTEKISGNHYTTISIKIPSTLTQQQEDALKELREIF
jgi:molecular chaperone DnaJ